MLSSNVSLSTDDVNKRFAQSSFDSECIINVSDAKSAADAQKWRGSLSIYASHNQCSRQMFVVCFMAVFNNYCSWLSAWVLLGWRFGVVVNMLVSINEVNLCCARLVLGWVTVYRVQPPVLENVSQYITSHPGQLSLAISPWVGVMSTKGRWCPAAGE